MSSSANTTTLPLPRANIPAPACVISLLQRLHAASIAQETDPAFVSHAAQVATLSAEQRTSPDFVAKNKTLMQDKFIALEREKCEALYVLLRALGATTVIEAGTSFGVSTIYLALAANQNAATRASRDSARVIATEHEATKAEKARSHWKEAGPDIESTIELREGDILETLAKDLPPQIDFVLLDIWAPLAYPTLELLLPHLRVGAVVATDNTLTHSEGYSKLLGLLRAPDGPFRSTTLPYAPGGLEISVYLP
ncbi:S-adenosyl-L-methionine-dependent methyltransferase [Auriculariales sp. MPI-PUGE-AT-0066]|nr:S-adenosyl-L-methionine-dependent methyltransferase [Auriculariales sp. MPI-PUGE-AT-0066]